MNTLFHFLKKESSKIKFYKLVDSLKISLEETIKLNAKIKNKVSSFISWHF